MVHDDYTVGALRLSVWCIATTVVGLGHSGHGAFRQRGIQTIIHCSLFWELDLQSVDDISQMAYYTYGVTVSSTSQPINNSLKTSVD